MRLWERIRETLGEDSQGFMRLWERIHEDLRIWERTLEEDFARI